MTKLTEGGFAEMWPDNGSPEVEALSFALQKEIAFILEKAEETNCYSNVDNLSEEILDYLAVELRAMYYDQSLTLDQKRAVIKSTLKWYMKAGTTSAVNEMMEVIFGEGDTLEWFDNEGYESEATDPYEFDVITSVGFVSASAEAIQTVTDVINRVKNVRSHLGTIYFSRTINKEKPILVAATLPWSFAVVSVYNQVNQNYTIDTGEASASHVESIPGVTIGNRIDKEQTTKTGAESGGMVQAVQSVTIA